MYVRETTEERIFNGKKITITVRVNRPSESAIKRCAETMTRIVLQAEERQKRAGN